MKTRNPNINCQVTTVKRDPCQDELVQFPEHLPPPTPALASESFLSHHYFSADTSPFKIAREEQKREQQYYDSHSCDEIHDASQPAFPRRRLLSAYEAEESAISYRACYDDDDMLTTSIMSSCSSTTSSQNALKSVVLGKRRRISDDNIQVSADVCIHIFR